MIFQRSAHLFCSLVLQRLLVISWPHSAVLKNSMINWSISLIELKWQRQLQPSFLDWTWLAAKKLNRHLIVAVVSDQRFISGWASPNEQPTSRSDAIPSPTRAAATAAAATAATAAAAATLNPFLSESHLRHHQLLRLRFSLDWALCSTILKE